MNVADRLGDDLHKLQGPFETHLDLLDRLHWYAAASGARAKNDRTSAAAHNLDLRRQGRVR
jgi:hypothetical protein